MALINTMYNKKNISEELCRVCLSEVEELSTLYERIDDVEYVHFADLLSICCNIKVSQYDRKPQKICRSCKDAAKISYKFKSTCQKSELYLNNKLESMDKPGEIEGTMEITQIKVEPCEIQNFTQNVQTNITLEEPNDESKIVRQENILFCNVTEGSIQEDFLDENTSQLNNPLFTNIQIKAEPMEENINRCSDYLESNVGNMQSSEYATEACDGTTQVKGEIMQSEENCHCGSSCGVSCKKNTFETELLEEAHQIDVPENIEDENENNLISTPPNLQTFENNVDIMILPQKSVQIYEKQYDTFLSWCRSNDVNNYTENIFLTYFSEKAKTLKSSTLWSIFSMLKSTFIIKHSIDISRFSRLITFIKKQNIGYKATKSNVFTREDINKFLIEAPNKQYLMWKVCLILGIAGACRIDELKKMNIDDIEDKDDVLIITIPESKGGKKRVFIVTNKMSCEYINLNPIEIYRQYRALRQVDTPHRSLFVFYRSGRCTIQPVGIHTFGKIPSLIASYLKLSDPNTYTGHAFRRTSASLLANKGQIF